MTCYAKCLGISIPVLAQSILSIATQSTTMKPPSTALLRAFSPVYSQTLPWAARGCLAQQVHQKASFSSTEQRQKRNKGQQKKDPRISMPTHRTTRDIEMLTAVQSSSATTSSTASRPAPYASPGKSFPHPFTTISSYVFTAPATSATGLSTAPGNFTNATSSTPKNKPSSANTTACVMPAKPCA